MRFKFERVFDNQLGMSILEGLVASTVLSIAVVGTTSLARYMYAQSHRAQVLNRAIMVQTSLVNALLNKNQYAKGLGRDALITAMNSPSGSAAGLEILSEPGTPNTKVLAVVGQRKMYALDGVDATCTQDCPIMVDVGFDCGGLGARGCMVAYRVSIAPNPGDVTPAPLGAMPGPASNPAAFAATDYSMGLSHDFFTQKLASDCGENDPTGQNILITGMDRTTGEVTCVPKQAVACAAPKIAHGVATGTGTGTKRLELQCHDLANVQCPAEYVLQQFDYGQLDGGKNFNPAAQGGTLAGMCGMCVYRWKTDIPWQGPTFQTAATSGGATYAATVCNTQYYDATANGSCAVAWDSNPPVHCPQTCNTTDPVTGAVTGTYDCSYDIVASAATSGTPPSGADNRASCTINVTQNSCSGGTTSGVAHGTWGGECKVKERIPNPSLKKAVVAGNMSCIAGAPGPGPTGPTATPTAGVCGPANGTTVASAPTAGLCSAGNASAVVGAGPWNWTCAGASGGGDANCSASKTSGGGPGPTQPPPTTPTGGIWAFVNVTPGVNVGFSTCPSQQPTGTACTPKGLTCGTSLIGNPGNPNNGTGLVLNFACQ